jgi:hypothetical protein
MRKALTTEQGKGEMEAHITQLEGSVKDLERQVGNPAVHASVDAVQLLHAHADFA